jgi:hypothetical protein
MHSLSSLRFLAGTSNQQHSLNQDASAQPGEKQQVIKAVIQKTVLTSEKYRLSSGRSRAISCSHTKEEEEAC